MSAIQQIVLHPYLSATLKFWSTTVGRDKTYRAIQYAARFLAWYEYRKGATKETVARLTALKSNLGLSRKLMRVGKFLEHFQSALKATAIQDPVVSYLAIGRQLGYAGYLMLDALQWVHGAKVYQFAPDTAKRISKNAARFWLTGLTFNLLSGSYKSYVLQKRLASAQRPRPTAEKEAARKLELQTIANEQASVRYQLTQDALDWLLPATGAGFLDLDEGILGLAGFTTAIMGARTQWRAVHGGKK